MCRLRLQGKGRRSLELVDVNERMWLYFEDQFPPSPYCFDQLLAYAMISANLPFAWGYTWNGKEALLMFIHVSLKVSKLDQRRRSMMFVLNPSNSSRDAAITPLLGNVRDHYLTKWYVHRLHFKAPAFCCCDIGFAPLLAISILDDTLAICRNLSLALSQIGKAVILIGEFFKSLWFC